MADSSCNPVEQSQRCQLRNPGAASRWGRIPAEGRGTPSPASRRGVANRNPFRRRGVANRNPGAASAGVLFLLAPLPAHLVVHSNYPEYDRPTTPTQGTAAETPLSSTFLQPKFHNAGAIGQVLPRPRRRHEFLLGRKLKKTLHPTTSS